MVVSSRGRITSRRRLLALVGVGALGAGLLTGCRLTEIASIVVSYQHACEVSTSGGVQCWGDNANGELGDGTTVSRVDPAPVAGVTSATQVALGSAHTCALLSDQTVQCWGTNANGELGDGTFANSLVPVTVSGITTAIQISAGASHTCAVLADSTMVCWGKNAEGEIGDSSTTNRGAPTAPSGPLTGVAQASAGFLHTCAVLTDGTGRCWGYNATGQVGDNTSGVNRLLPTTVVGLTGATLISAGGFHTCAVVAAGAAQCWGTNSFGQVGDGTTTMRLAPVGVSGLTGAIALVTGSSRSCASTGSAVSCWGGSAITGSTTVPAPTSWGAVISVSAGGDSTCVVLPDGTAQCSGLNANGQLGNGSMHTLPGPTVVGTADPVDGVSLVDAGPESTCAAKPVGSTICWGNNSYGQLGAVSTVYKVPLATTFPGLTGVSSVSVSDFHGCAVVGGTVACWGENTTGALGDGTTTSSASPVAVSGISTATHVAVSSEFNITPGAVSCALLSAGSVQCWGNGKLGNPSISFSTTPVTVSGIATATQISLGTTHGCARLSDGTATCWGNNANGRLGDGTTTTSSTPVVVAGLTTVIQIEAGDKHTCALLADGTVDCWGANTSGQLGDGTTTGHVTAAPVSGLASVAQITTGKSHTCALLADATARCWGANTSSQLGDGTSTQRSLPVAVSGLAGATHVSAGGSHSCALIPAGALRCWGSNDHGKVGDGRTANQTTPVAVKAPIT